MNFDTGIKIAMKDYQHRHSRCLTCSVQSRFQLIVFQMTVQFLYCFSFRSYFSQIVQDDDKTHHLAIFDVEWPPVEMHQAMTYTRLREANIL